MKNSLRGIVLKNRNIILEVVNRTLASVRNIPEKVTILAQLGTQI